jgi:hypothetical protein
MSKTYKVPVLFHGTTEMFVEAKNQDDAFMVATRKMDNVFVTMVGPDDEFDTEEVTFDIGDLGGGEGIEEVEL